MLQTAQVVLSSWTLMLQEWASGRQRGHREGAAPSGEGWGGGGGAGPECGESGGGRPCAFAQSVGCSKQPATPGHASLSACHAPRERAGRGLPMETASRDHGPKNSLKKHLYLFQDRRRHGPEQEHPRVRQCPDQEEFCQEQVEGKSRGARPRGCDPRRERALQLEGFSCPKVMVTRVR